MVPFQSVNCQKVRESGDKALAKRALQAYAHGSITRVGLCSPSKLRKLVSGPIVSTKPFPFAFCFPSCGELSGDQENSQTHVQTAQSKNVLYDDLYAAALWRRRILARPLLTSSSDAKQCAGGRICAVRRSFWRGPLSCGCCFCFRSHIKPPDKR